MTSLAPAFLTGERCRLRPLRREDVDGPWRDWLNDPEVTRHLQRGAFPATRESTLAYYESVASSGDGFVLAVDTPDGQHVGNVGLHRIDWVNRSAEFGIVIGARDHWGRGIGGEATRLVAAHGFARLNLHRIWLGVLAEHAAARRAYERAGFRVEGTMREAVFSGGRYHDDLIMGLLASELRTGDAPDPAGP